MTESGTVEAPFSSLAKGVWWLLLLRGALAVIFGIVAILAPAAALTGIALVIGAYAIVDGIATVVHAFQLRGSHPQWGWLLASGIITALAGLAALILPGFAGFFGGLFVLWTVVFWNIMTGALGLRSAAGAASGRAKTWGIVSGAASLLFGVILAVALLLNPGTAVLSLVWVVGIWAVVFGVMLIVTAIMARSGTKTAAA